MQVRRCAALALEPREKLEFDLAQIMAGASGLVARRQWVALAAHLDEEVVLDVAELDALGRLPVADWVPRDALLQHTAGAVLDRLVECGLLIADAPEHAATKARDEEVRGSHWLALSAVLHRHTRWQGVDTFEAEAEFSRQSDRPFLERLGAPEALVRERTGAAQRLKLDKPDDSALEQLIRRRVTCRNWDARRALSAEDFAHTLFRVFAARAVNDAPGIDVMKRAVPSAGGLHPTEAYLLVQHVEGVAPGLYHYHPVEHALEPLAGIAADETRALALRMVAGQRHFADAHVLIVLASRFRRTTWKYRNHAKAYRALVLDAGHLSQTLHLAATERGLAAFITAAVNERDIEEIFALDPLREGVIAVCGFGWRGTQVEEAEFDPLGSVWPAPETAT